MNKITNIYNETVNEENHIYTVNEYSEFHLFEASFGRINDHTKKGYIIMTAFRRENTLEYNMSHNDDLKEDLKDLALGYFEIDGAYEEKDIDINDDNITKTGDVHNEISLFIPYRDVYTYDEFKNIAMDLAKRYKQQSVAYSEGEGQPIYELYQNGKLLIIGHKITFDKVFDDEKSGYIPNNNDKTIYHIYSQLRSGRHSGRRFVIEGVRIPNGADQSYNFKINNQLW